MLKSNLINTICNNYCDYFITKKEALDILSDCNKHFSWGLTDQDMKAIERKAYKQAVNTLSK